MTIISLPGEVKPKEDDIVDIKGLGLMRVVKTYGGSFCRDVFLGERIDVSQARLIVKTFDIKDDESILSSEEASLIEQSILCYRQRLLTAKATVVDGIGFNSYTNGGKTQLLQYESWEGETASHLLWQLSDEGSGALIRAIYRQIIEPVFDNCSDPEQDGWLLDGLDMKVRNVAVKGDLMAGYSSTYVDLFSWKTSDLIASSRHYSLEYPEPTNPLAIALGKTRSYSKAGVLMDFFMSLVKNKPERADHYYEVMGRLVKESDPAHHLMDRIAEYAQGNTLNIGCLAQKKIDRLIGDWGPQEVFLIRLLACAMAFHRAEARQHLDKIFATTHFQQNPPTKIPEAKDLLLLMAGCPVSTKRTKSLSG